MKRALLCLLLTGCVTTPTEGWHREFDFNMQKLDWTHVYGPDAYNRLVNLCARDTPDPNPLLNGCAFRIVGSQMCVVFSLYSQEQAPLVRMSDGTNHYEHELRHCGVFAGVNIGGAWGHA